MITDEQKAEYLLGQGVYCPYCGRSAIYVANGREYFHGKISDAVQCSDCGKEWTDVYKLVGIHE